jgi:hypothetical protein
MKTGNILAAIFIAILSVGFASAYNVCGNVYWTATGDPVANAGISARCSDDMDIFVVGAPTDENGHYCINGNFCSEEEDLRIFVTAESGDVSATDWCRWNNDHEKCGNLNLYLPSGEVPEFGAISASLAVIGAAAGFAMMRRRK